MVFIPQKYLFFIFCVIFDFLFIPFLENQLFFPKVIFILLFLEIFFGKDLLLISFIFLFTFFHELLFKESFGLETACLTLFAGFTYLLKHKIKTPHFMLVWFSFGLLLSIHHFILESFLFIFSYFVLNPLHLTTNLLMSFFLFPVLFMVYRKLQHFSKPLKE